MPTELAVHPSRSFLRFAAVAALVTALTTLIVHLVPELWSDVTTFEARVALREDPVYMARFWAVLVHCALVVVSMAGVGALAWRGAPARVGLGFLGFVVFAVAEIARTSMAIFALNRTWRSAYAAASSELDRALRRATIEAFAGTGEALFFVFLSAFAVGLFCYGSALRTRNDGRWLGWLLLAWGILTLPGWIDTVTGTTRLGALFGWVGSVFQPIARTAIGAWLWRRAEEARHGPAG